MVSDAASAAAACFHCGLDVPPGIDLEVDVEGAMRPMCCIGCQAVAEMLVRQGLEDWYRTRDAPSGIAAETVPEVLADAEYLALEDCAAEFATRDREGGLEVSLLAEGMSCPACAWVIERHLGAMPGLLEVRVNLSSHHVHVRWAPEQVDLEAIVTRLAEIGFVARPDRPDEATALARDERRAALVRIGIAGLATMNVMTYAIALYAGAIDGMPEGVRQFMRWMCWLVTTPVVAISARPFFTAATRDLAIGRPGMDVPVSIAIAGAYLVSAWAVVSGTGEVYFESVCMFTFFLGTGRFLEMNVRHKAAALSRRLLDGAPSVARRLAPDGSHEVVRVNALRVGDHVRVMAGEALPTDGWVVEGRSAVDEALLSGEPWPRRVEAGGGVVAGSLNAESSLIVEVTRVAAESTLAVLVGMIERAQSEKPAIARLSDRIASRFVVVMLGVAALTAITWAFLDPARAVWVTLSVLVATCPCALGLATPAALAAATDGLARAGFLVTRGHTLESLARLDRMVFDKTGTLTRGEPTVERVIALDGGEIAELMARAWALESSSGHVFARAFEPRESGARALGSDVVTCPGSGVEGKIDGRRCRLGRPDWAASIATAESVPAMPDDDTLSWVLLADERGPQAWFGVGDPVRSEADSALRSLRDQALGIELLSGDPSPTVLRLARRFAFDEARGAATPESKVQRIREIQRGGAIVGVVGDGLNDGPVMGTADVSIAMGSGCDLTRVTADAILLNNELTLLPQAVAWARRTRRVIRQNLGWAVGYNLLVLPLAVTGQLPPWLAALGMSASSLIVATNATRLRHGPRST